MILWVTLCDVLPEWSAGASRLDYYHWLLLSSQRNSMLFCGFTMTTCIFVLLHIDCSSWWLPHRLRVLRGLQHLTVRKFVCVGCLSHLVTGGR